MRSSSSRALRSCSVRRAARARSSCSRAASPSRVRSSSPRPGRRGPVGGRRRGGRRERAGRRDEREAVGEQRGELVLELGDLRAQRRPRGALGVAAEAVTRSATSWLSAGSQSSSPPSGPRASDATSGRGARRRRFKGRAARSRSTTAPPRRRGRGRRGPGSRKASARAVRARGSWPRASSPNSTATGPSASATTSLPSGSGAGSSERPSSSPSRLVRIPSGPSTRAASSAHTGTPVSSSASIRMSSSMPAGEEAAAQHPLDDRGLDRRPLQVGVDPDLAEEDAVRRRDRLATDADRPSAADAVGELAHPRLDVRRRGRP